MAHRIEAEIEGKHLTLSNLEKVLYPSTGFTKAQVIDYYVKIAPVLLPHIRSRPLTLKRYPEGTHGFFFYEKQCPAHHPAWLGITRIHSDSQAKDVDYCTVKSTADLVWIANLASIELHVLLAKAENVEQPTQMVFDLDPGETAGLLDCLWAGLELKRYLDANGLQSFPKTSGGKGLHVSVPLNTSATYHQTKAFSHAVAQTLEERYPDRITSNMRKALRRGKILVDWSQNSEHKTTVAAYSLRAMDVPSVSTPVTWREVWAAFQKKDPGLLNFGPAEVLRRAAEMGDLFDPVLTLKQRLPK